MADFVNVRVAQTRFSELLRRVEAGEEIVLARAGKPCARLVPYEPRKRREPGRFSGITVPPEFFDPLPDNELAAWDGG